LFAVVTFKYNVQRAERIRITSTGLNVSVICHQSTSTIRTHVLPWQSSRI